jgi:hypothetical protein
LDDCCGTDWLYGFGGGERACVGGWFFEMVNRLFRLVRRLVAWYWPACFRSGLLTTRWS